MELHGKIQHLAPYPVRRLSDDCSPIGAPDLMQRYDLDYM
jgi:hypothetical protein